jgi:hypothetical protein
LEWSRVSVLTQDLSCNRIDSIQHHSFTRLQWTTIQQQDPSFTLTHKGRLHRLSLCLACQVLPALRSFYSLFSTVFTYLLNRLSTMRFSHLALTLLMAATSHVIRAEICTSDTNEFHAHVDLHAGELGYYWFEECGENVVNPTLGLEVGQVYTFYQTDRSNYMHPLGYAYFPDGAHEDMNELEPVVSSMFV